MIQTPMIPTKPTDAQLAAAWAADIAADPAAVFLDTETTSLDMETVEVCDIAVVACDGTVLLDELIRPDGEIPAAAVAVHGITPAMVAACPSWQDIAPRLRSILHGRRVVVFNASYDSKVVNRLCRVLSQPDIAVGWECGMLAFAALRGERSRTGSGYRWFKQDAAAAHFGIEPGGHRAKSDAETCRRIVRAMAEMASGSHR